MIGIHLKRENSVVGSVHVTDLTMISPGELEKDLLR